MLSFNYRIKTECANSAMILPQAGARFTALESFEMKRLLMESKIFMTVQFKFAGISVIAKRVDELIANLIKNVLADKKGPALSKVKVINKDDLDQKNKAYSDVLNESEIDCWLSDIFGKDFADKENRAALICYLSGATSKFEGRMTRKWLPGLKALSALKGPSIVDLAVVKRALLDSKI